MGQSILLLIRQGWAVQTQAAEGTAQVDLNRSRIVMVQDTERAYRERTFESANEARFLHRGLCAKSGWRKARPGRQRVDAKSGKYEGTYLCRPEGKNT